MVEINVESNLRQMTRELDAFARKQVPFATAQALNAVGKKIQKAEQDNIRATFKNPRPFTQNSIGFSRATKRDATVTVFVKDIAAKYLEPYETGGVHYLPGRALLNPKDIRLDAYGQLPRNTLAKLKARPDIFIGVVKSKAGPVNGVWQRVANLARAPLLNAKGKKLRGLNRTTQLKLLIRFGDALPVHQHLGFGATARQIVAVSLGPEFEKALAAALTTGR